jgi:hypothetical protein
MDQTVIPRAYLANILLAEFGLSLGDHVSPMLKQQTDAQDRVIAGSSGCGKKKAAFVIEMKIYPTCNKARPDSQ